jgi:hypothetical protein
MFASWQPTMKEELVRVPQAGTSLRARGFVLSLERLSEAWTPGRFGSKRRRASGFALGGWRQRRKRTSIVLGVAGAIVSVVP